MKFISTNCPACGAGLNIDIENKQAYCQYCGNKLLIDDEIQRTQLDITEDSGYKFEKGRQRAIEEAHEESRRRAEEEHRKYMEEEFRRSEEAMRRSIEEEKYRAEEALKREQAALSIRKCSAGLKKGIISTAIAVSAILASVLMRDSDATFVFSLLALLINCPFSIVAIIHSIRGAVIKNGANIGLKIASLVFAPLGPILSFIALLSSMSITVS